ncbi:glycerate kinase family protein [Fructilactobacillus sp. Tb1]|uniref:glycerate kinase family protein n=1 Tax=Fructilactobacillus sp. Tb1 TaxID=3422304 RepID=UPI003D2E01FC
MSLKFVLAPDSFKESMTAKQVCDAMKIGIKKAMPTAEITKVPMADGGEGTVDSLVDATDGHKVFVEVNGPLPDQKVDSYFGILGDGKTAVIEMAKASGIELVPPEKRDPFITTTFGTGELIIAALNEGVQKIIIGIGGSATTDGGIGMAAALGIKFYDKNHKIITPNGAGLNKINSISTKELDSRIKNTEFIVASDVTNPLTGANGSAAVFGPQKGASAEGVKKLDAGLTNYANVVKQELNIDIKDVPGSGAAGGLGAGLIIFTNATLKPGIDIVIDAINLKEKIKNADIVLTGEGGIDFQTKFGKTPFGVAQVAKEFNKPVIVEAGYIGKGIDELYQDGITAIFGILGHAGPLSDALKDGSTNITRTTENIVRTLQIK